MAGLCRWVGVNGGAELAVSSVGMQCIAAKLLRDHRSCQNSSPHQEA